MINPNVRRLSVDAQEKDKLTRVLEYQGKMLVVEITHFPSKIGSSYHNLVTGYSVNCGKEIKPVLPEEQADIVKYLRQKEGLEGEIEF